jgi:hypothetical protein
MTAERSLGSRTAFRGGREIDHDLRCLPQVQDDCIGGIASRLEPVRRTRETLHHARKMALHSRSAFSE